MSETLVTPETFDKKNPEKKMGKIGAIWSKAKPICTAVHESQSYKPSDSFIVILKFGTV